MGEDWAVIAGRAGLYIFDGGEPVKISQEIQPLWDTINWAAGQTLWVRVDTRNKRILCGVPIGAATSPNLHSGARLSQPVQRRRNRIARLGALLDALGKTVRRGPLAQVVPVEHHRECLRARRTLRRHRASVSRQRPSGGAGNGKIYQLSDTQFSDDGAAINSYYTTYFFLSHDLEQTLSSPRAPQTFRLSHAVRRRGRELEPLRVRRQRSVSHGARRRCRSLRPRRRISSCPSTCSANASRSRWARTRPARGSSLSDSSRR